MSDVAPLPDGALAPESRNRPIALIAERRAQLRALLLLALVLLVFLILRARPLLLFHAGWWRL